MDDTGPPRQGRPPGIYTKHRTQENRAFWPGEWINDALCSPRTAEYFFSITPSERETAKQICAHCPVKDACADWAIPLNVQGIWGGLTEEERAHLRRERGGLDRSSDGTLKAPQLPE